MPDIPRGKSNKLNDAELVAIILHQIQVSHSQPIMASGCTQRIVAKDGTYRIRHSAVPNGCFTYFRNAFSLLLDMKWRWIFLMMFLAFPLTWGFFATVYFAIASYHGDFEPLGANETDRALCIGNTKGMLSMFLFSLESQTTIGYGFRYITESCPLAITCLCFQYLTGAILEACVVSLIWVRLIRPKNRAKQIMFSRYAVVKPDEKNRPCFRIRLFDTHAKNLVQTWIRLYFAKKTPVESGSATFTFELKWMDLGQMYGKEKLLLLWPVEVVHVIDSASPLYKYSVCRDAILDYDFEIIAVAEGIVGATGLVTQIRTSYSPDEIKWDHQFAPIEYTKEGKDLRMISKELDNVVPIGRTKPNQLSISNSPALSSVRLQLSTP